MPCWRHTIDPICCSSQLEDPYAAARQALEGRTVSHYKVGRRLGAGGMGVVYEATDERLRRRVALKFLPPGFGRETEARQRFETEAQTAAAADHPNVCGLRDRRDQHRATVHRHGTV